MSFTFSLFSKMDFVDPNEKPDGPFAAQIATLKLKYRLLLDQATPMTVQRWAAVYVLIGLFMLRIVFAEGWYIICYTWAIFMLNLFLKFLTPKFDPSLEEDMRTESIEEGMQNMGEQDEEFRPFIRRLPEFQFWEKASWATVGALVASFIPILDIPVFWPILLVYFIVLFFLTMRRQIQHMVKFHYIPWDLGKMKYTGSSN